MRTRAFVVTALLVLPSLASGQIIPRPRTGGRTPLEPAPPSREIPEVSRALSYHRARWSAEAYSLVSAVQVSAGTDGVTDFSTFGAGSRADYRFTDRFSATMDMTVSPFGAGATSQTAEAGVRYSPMPLHEEVRAFVDVRAAFMNLSDPLALGTVGGVNQQRQRYSRGFGGVVGAGIEYAFRPNLAVTATATGMRNRMTVYKLENVANIPVGSRYSLNSYRFALGFKYNPTSILQAAQTAR